MKFQKKFNNLKNIQLLKNMDKEELNKIKLRQMYKSV